MEDDTSAWTNRPAWRDAARAKGWHPKPRVELRALRRARSITPDVVEAASMVFEEAELLAEIARMANTAVRTAAYANGQTELRTVKPKDIGFTRAELEEEIVYLLDQQCRRCALTGLSFRPNETNPHLKLSLDRKNSSLGYVPGNLQIVTRAANFYKSASDASDWQLKEDALYRVAVAIHRRRMAASEAVG